MEILEKCHEAQKSCTSLVEEQDSVIAELLQQQAQLEVDLIRERNRKDDLQIFAIIGAIVAGGFLGFSISTVF